MMVLFWGGLIMLGVLALRAYQRSSARHGGSTALDVLQARYARGELAKEQYEEIRRDLER